METNCVPVYYYTILVGLLTKYLQMVESYHLTEIFTSQTQKNDTIWTTRYATKRDGG